MKVDGTAYRAIWRDAATGAVRAIDQRWLPHHFRIAALDSLEDFATAIRDMWVRGAPLIGATAAYGVAAEMARDATDAALREAYGRLIETRPTAINLKWALDRCHAALIDLTPAARPAAAAANADEKAHQDVPKNPTNGQ
ncbi:MAG: S-methyl-5-thioribose-1-phosphate isomerase, partial [Pseudomonadota bacterium]|nr:S-methyl-5-thioribose-1-phosphate isomerase [Pseudomonadota bacterium]